MAAAKKSFYASLVQSSSSKPRALWKTIHSILYRTVNRSLPTSSNLAALPQLFATYFSDKISKLHFNLQINPSSTPALSMPPSLPPLLFHSCHLTRNRQFTISSVRFILWSRSCSNHCTKENFQHNISNYHFNGKSFHNHRYLRCHLKIIYNQPTVKKPSLHKEDLSNYRPIANLSFISKLTEKIVIKRLLDH